jgi:hypothetical protein
MAVARTESHTIDDMEMQPPPAPAAPTMRMDMVPSLGAMIGWTYSPAEAAALSTLSITSWEAQWGFPVLGSWEDLPTTTGAQEGEDADLLFMKITTFDVVKEWRASVSGLDRGSWYVFRVRGVNETGPGAWSEVSVALCVRPDKTIAAGQPGLGGYLPEWLSAGGRELNLNSQLGRQDELKKERDAAAAEVAALGSKIKALEAVAAAKAAAQPSPARADV